MPRYSCFVVFLFEEVAFILLAPSWFSGSAILCLMLINLRKDSHYTCLTLCSCHIVLGYFVSVV